MLGSTYLESTAATPPPAVASGSIGSNGGASALAVVTQFLERRPPRAHGSQCLTPAALQAVLGSTYSESTAAPPPPAVASGSIESDGGASALAVMTTNAQGQILGVDGLALAVQGITWAGFDSSTFLDDLDTVSLAFAVSQRAACCLL